MTENEMRILTSLAMMCAQYHWEDDWQFYDVGMEMNEAAAKILAEYGLLDVRGRMVRWSSAGQNLLQEAYSYLLEEAYSSRSMIIRPKPRCMTETEKRIMIPLVMQCVVFFWEEEGKFYHIHMSSNEDAAETLDAFGLADEYPGYILWTEMGRELIGQGNNVTQRSSRLTL